MRFDWKQLSTLDRVVVGGAAVAFIALFLPWYGVSVGPFSASVSGWSAGFTGWAGGLLLTVAGVLLVLRRPADPVEQQRQRDVVGRGQLGHQLPELEHEAERGAPQFGSPGLGELVEPLPVEDDLALVRREDAVGSGEPIHRAACRATARSFNPGRVTQRSSGSSSCRLHSCQEPA